MLKEIGAKSIEDLLSVIPAQLRVKSLKLPEAIRSESGLRAHVEGMLSKP